MSLICHNRLSPRKFLNKEIIVSPYMISSLPVRLFRTGTEIQWVAWTATDNIPNPVYFAFSVGSRKKTSYRESRNVSRLYYYSGNSMTYHVILWLKKGKSSFPSSINAGNFAAAATSDGKSLMTEQKHFLLGLIPQTILFTGDWNGFIIRLWFS